MKIIQIQETEKKAKLREKILDISAELFKNKGYENTTLKDIAKSVKKKKSTIYYYFSSKEEIFQNVVLNEAVQFRRCIIKSINAEENPIDKFKIYIIKRLEIINIYQNFHLTLKNEKFNHIHFFKRLNILYDKEEIRLFKNILKEGVKNNFLKQNFDIDLAAEAIIMAIKGIESSFFAINQNEDYKNKIENIIELLLYGIAKK